MAVTGIHHVLVETHDWEASLAFWRELGWELTEDHGTAGKLTGPGGGPYLWLNQVGANETPALDIYFELQDAQHFAPKAAIEIVAPLTTTHWGTKLMQVRDADGRIVRLQAS
jgi:catechol 2,3-dioxygenase-like lactoylglutathione lyase family enzyme